MITLNIEGAKRKNRGAEEQQIRDIVDTHLTFPGSDKLKMGVNIKENGAFSVSFTGPQEAIAEAKRLWQENVKPAAAKVQRAATKLKRQAKRAANATKLKPAKKAAPKRKAATKAKTVKKAAKSAIVRAKAKVSKKTTKKRKS
jgi:hypothetical protein